MIKSYNKFETIDISLDPVCLTQEILLPDVTERIGHFAIREREDSLFLSCVGYRCFVEIDCFNGIFVNERNDWDCNIPQGICYEDSNDCIYIANKRNGLVRKLPIDSNRYDKKSISFGKECGRMQISNGKVWVAYDDSLGAIDVKNNKIDDSSHFHLTGSPEEFQLESEGSKIFVNIPCRKSVMVVCRNDKSYRKEYCLPSGHSDNFPLCYDEHNQRLFVGLRRPSKLIVMNAINGLIIANLPCSMDMDDICYDSQLGIIFVICGEGYVHCFKQTFDHNKQESYHDIGRCKTSIGARTGIWHTKRRQLYVAAPVSSECRVARVMVFEPNMNMIESINT